MRSGFTLLECLTALALAAFVSAGLIAPARALQDRFAVSAAVEGTASLVAQARAMAPLHWGSVVRVSAISSSVRVELGDSVAGRLELERDLGVTVELSRGRRSATLVFGPMGLGRVAGETIRFRRRGTEAVLVVSAYGRTLRR